MKPSMDDVVSLCSSMIAIDSINPFCAFRDPDGRWSIEGNEQEMLDFCERWLRTHGFQTTRQPCGGGRENLLAQKGSGEHSVLLYGHVDTVEVKEGWSREEALSAKLAQKMVDGRLQEVLVGLGANDMKGGLAVLLSAAADFEPSSFCLKIALGCDEEFWSLGSHALVHESDFLEDVALILVPEVGESTSEPVPGHWLVTLGRCGRTELVVDCPGTGGHGAEPESPGRVNAITQAAKIAVMIEEYSAQLPTFYPFPPGPQCVKSSALVTQLNGGTGTLSIPDKAQLVVNRVLIPGETPETALDELRQLLKDAIEKGHIKTVQQGERSLLPSVSIRERPTPPLRPYLIDPGQPLVADMLTTLANVASFEMGMGVSVADENRFGAETRIPVIVLGPRGEDSHAAYEWVTTESLRQLREIYLSLLLQLDAASSFPATKEG